jgi:hypothetical protein
MGVVIAASLLGWRTEETRIRCDDWRSVVEQPGVHIRIPTLDKECASDERMPLARFPRHLSQSPDGKTYVFTTQLRNPNFDNTRPVAGRFSGSICTSPADGSTPPTCTGVGTAQGMAESETLDRFFVANWGPVLEGGRRGGRVYAIARSHPLRVLAERELTVLSGELFHDPQGDLIGRALGGLRPKTSSVVPWSLSDGTCKSARSRNGTKGEGMEGGPIRTELGAES